MQLMSNLIQQNFIPFVFNRPGQQGYFFEVGIIKETNYLRHCLELSNLEQDVDKIPKSLADALTTAVNVFTFKKK